jgi:hypothetical protein
MANFGQVWKSLRAIDSRWPTHLFFHLRPAELLVPRAWEGVGEGGRTVDGEVCVGFKIVFQWRKRPSMVW